MSFKFYNFPSIQDGTTDQARGEVEIRLWWKHNPGIAAQHEMELPPSEPEEEVEEAKGEAGVRLADPSLVD